MKLQDAGKRKMDNSFSSIAAAARRPEMVSIKNEDDLCYYALLLNKPRSNDEVIKAVIKKANWASVTLEDKLRSQYPRDITYLHI